MYMYVQFKTSFCHFSIRIRWRRSPRVPKSERQSSVTTDGVILLPKSISGWIDFVSLLCKLSITQDLNIIYKGSWIRDGFDSLILKYIM